MVGFVYLWVNKINGKKYIGSHIGRPDDGYTGSGKLFRQAVSKYGIENFERIILETCGDRQMLREREDHFLRLFNAAHDRNFYNLRSTAGGGWDYVNANPQFAVERGKKHSAYLRENHPRGMAGKVHSDETKRRMAVSQREAARKNPVIQMDLDGNFVREHESVSAAARFVKGSPSNIKYTIEGKFKHAYRHTWKYK